MYLAVVCRPLDESLGRASAAARLRKNAIVGGSSTNRDRYMSGTCVLVQLSYSCSTCIRDGYRTSYISYRTPQNSHTLAQAEAMPRCRAAGEGQGNKWSDEISRVIRPQIMTK